MMFFEVFYFIAIIKHFITDFTPIGEIKPVRDYKKIAIHYLKGNFTIDFILWVPIVPLFGHLQKEIIRLCIIKCYRLFKVLQIFNVNTIVKHIKERQRKMMEKIGINEIESEQDTSIDYNRISFNMYVRYGLQIVKLIVNSFNIAFFVGAIWVIYGDMMVDLFVTDKENKFHKENFSKEYELETNSIRTIVIVMYWSFTTLSSVGFGDYYP